MRRAILVTAAVLFCATVRGAVSRAAEYPRRIAIAPFSSQSQDNIAAAVSIIPRLLSVRLMAAAGAETVLLPPDARSPADAAREAKAPLLLQGTVSKLGKGFSIDTTVLETETGKTVGAFFVAPATEDDVIPELGRMASEICEKLFGVKAAPRPAVAAAPPTVAAVPATETGRPAPAAGPAAPEAQPAAPTPAPRADEGWTPSSLVKLSETDKIVDEIFGVVAGSVDANGDGDVVAYGKRRIYIYRVKGSEIKPFTRLERPLSHHILSVDTMDVDGDGRKDIAVTSLAGDVVESAIYRSTGESYEPIAERLPYFLAVLPDWNGKPALVGQSRGVDVPFKGKFLTLSWDGKKLREGEPLPANPNMDPLSSGVLTLSSMRFGKEWRLLYTDQGAHIRILEPSGKGVYKSRRLYGSPKDSFEWGEINRLEQRRKEQLLPKGPRPVAGPGGAEYVLIPEVTKASLMGRVGGEHDSTRVVLLRWDGGEFLEKAASVKSEHFYSGADSLSPSALRKGGKVIASVIRTEEGVIASPESRLILLAFE